ncbi:MAG: ATP synthase F1 subunit gamma [Patescibacteria group bacterium]
MEENLMANERVIKNRIGATKNIRQITKAMEAVAAVKMRKSEQAALSTRPYALAALQILKNLSNKIETDLALLSPLLAQRPIKKIALVVVTSDKGLAGAFNSNVLRRAEEFIKNAPADTEVQIISVGKKAKSYFEYINLKILKQFDGVGDLAELHETEPIAKFLEQLFAEEKTAQVVFIFTNFLSVLKQEVLTRILLPFSEKTLEEIVRNTVPLRGRYSGIPNALGLTTDTLPYIFEPSPEQVLRQLLPHLFYVEVHQVILEANASEHSSRMVAMKNAADNARELIEELTLSYNKARQAKITKELLEISK